MHAYDIIRMRASTEGFDLDRGSLIDTIISDIESGRDLLYEYGDVLYTLGTEDAFIHTYSASPDKFAFYRASRQFSKDCWGSGHTRVFAPILNPRLRLFAARMDMRYLGQSPTGHRIYYADRSFYE